MNEPVGNLGGPFAGDTSGPRSDRRRSSRCGGWTGLSYRHRNTTVENRKQFGPLDQRQVLYLQYEESEYWELG